MDTQSHVNGGVRMAESTTQEAYGASQIGPFDYCPKLGFREYWYPAIEARRVRSKPVHLQMLGDDLVLFRDATGRVAALSDWCPHRGARLSLGVCEFKGTVTCPYHGYTFDGTGQCVAALIERPDSPFIGKLRARPYPTEERMGIVFVWTGETEPVPLGEDLPAELSDPELTGRRYRGAQHNVELPSKIRVMIGASIHLRWMVPVTEHDTRVWTFTLVRKPKHLLHAAWQALWYHCYRKPSILIATNEKEDLVVFKRERLNLERPQKLGPLDVGLIYFRRHLAQRARDYQRLGRAEGALRSSSRRSAQPPPPSAAAASIEDHS